MGELREACFLFLVTIICREWGERGRTKNTFFNKHLLEELPSGWHWARERHTEHMRRVVCTLFWTYLLSLVCFAGRLACIQHLHVWNYVIYAYVHLYLLGWFGTYNIYIVYVYIYTFINMYIRSSQKNEFNHLMCSKKINFATLKSVNSAPWFESDP